jgi:hypothetical protein
MIRYNLYLAKFLASNFILGFVTPPNFNIESYRYLHYNAELFTLAQIRLFFYRMDPDLFIEYQEKGLGFPPKFISTFDQIIDRNYRK